MLTRTLPEIPSIQTETSESITQSVDERGFYLYEWISPDELRMTLDRDYLIAVKYASIPLAIITGIAGFLGLAWWWIGAILASLIVLMSFYWLLFFGLFIRFMYHAYLYTRWANVVITDNHYVSGGNIIEKTNREKISKAFSLFENTFDEQFLGPSELIERKEHAKRALFDSLKQIASWWGKIIQNVWRSRESGGIVLAIILIGFLYSFMMGAVYFIGMFFIGVFGRIFSWAAHRYLLAMSNQEHLIQTLFQELDSMSKKLQSEKDITTSLLTEAWQNAWKENLLGKLNNSIELLGKLAGDGTDTSIELKKILEQSKYKDIFNFIKYGNWIKSQILEPIESILLLLEKNHAIIVSTLSSLESQIAWTSDPALRSPLILQYDRLQIQKESFERVMAMLEGYREKLK